MVTLSRKGTIVQVIYLNTDDRKRQGKSTENVGLVGKVEPLKPISCGHCGKPDHIITNCWKLGGNLVNIVVSLIIKVRIVELPKISSKKELNPLTSLTSLKGVKVSPFNESGDSKSVSVKPLIDQNNFVEKNKGIKVNPLNDVKVALRTKLVLTKDQITLRIISPLFHQV